MITHPGEYHDATSTISIPQSRRTLDLIEQGLLMPPLPIQVALRAGRSARVVRLPAGRWSADADAA